MYTCGPESVQLMIYRHTFSFDVDHNCTTSMCVDISFIVISIQYKYMIGIYNMQTLHSGDLIYSNNQI